MLLQWAKLPIHEVYTKLTRVCSVIDLELTPDVRAIRRALDKGLGFSPTPKCDPTKAIQACQSLYDKVIDTYHKQFQQTLSWGIPMHLQGYLEREHCLLQQAIVDHLTKHQQMRMVRRMKRKRLKYNLAKEESQALKLLTPESPYIVLHSDKTKRPILTSKQWYKQQMLNILCDDKTYWAVGYPGSIPYELTPASIRHKIDKILPMLPEAIRSHIKRARNLQKGESVIPPLYGRVKDHKPVVVVRPIAANHSYETTQASVAVDKIMQPLLKKIPSIVHGSKHFVQRIEEFKLSMNNPSEVEFATFDVEQLYPSMDQEYTVVLLDRFLTRNAPHITGRQRKAICDLVHIILKHNLVIFNGVVYLQTGGIAMGTPVAVSLAQTYMHENEIDVSKHLYVYLYLRFIDDIFAIVLKGFGSTLFKALNNLHPSIRVTGQVTQDRAIMLDSEVYKGSRAKEGRLDVELHVKPIDSRAFLHYDSYHPQHVFTGIVKGAILRCILHNSEVQRYLVHRQRLIKALLSRSYPLSLLDLVMQQYSYSQRAGIIARNRPKADLSNTIITKIMPNPSFNLAYVTLMMKHKVREWGKLINAGMLPITAPTRLLVAMQRNQTLSERLVRSRYEDYKPPAAPPDVLEPPNPPKVRPMAAADRPAKTKPSIRAAPKHGNALQRSNIKRKRTLGNSSVNMIADLPPNPNLPRLPNHRKRKHTQSDGGTTVPNAQPNRIAPVMTATAPQVAPTVAVAPQSSVARGPVRSAKRQRFSNSAPNIIADVPGHSGNPVRQRECNTAPQPSRTSKSPTPNTVPNPTPPPKATY